MVLLKLVPMSCEKVSLLQCQGSNRCEYASTVFLMVVRQKGKTFEWIVQSGSSYARPCIIILPSQSPVARTMRTETFCGVCTTSSGGQRVPHGSKTKCDTATLKVVEIRRGLL